MAVGPFGLHCLFQFLLKPAQAGALDVFAIRKVGNSVGGSDYPQEFFDLVVIRSQVLVRDGPVLADAVETGNLEVVIRHPHRDAAPGK